MTTGKPMPKLLTTHSSLPTYSALWLGIKTEQKTLYKKISLRLKQRLKAGMVKEVEKLRKHGLSWKRLEAFGLEYKFVSLFLQKKTSRDEMFNQLLLAIQHYAKRQNTWWKKNQKINWIKPNLTKAKKLVVKFLQ